jgi:ParB-like chromosome segregation protein Spo0J
MASPVKMAFQPEGIVIPIDDILPLKKVSISIKKSKKYSRITSSIQEVGIIEPLIVFPQKGGKIKYLLLDGHIRLEVLQELKHKEVLCLISTDDESFTYNHKVNQLATIQEHFMILRAIKNGVSEERIAKTLDVDIAKIRRNRNLLNGICSEAIGLLKDKGITSNALRILNRMKPMRQVEVSELLIAANNYAVPYVKALLAATRQDQLIDTGKAKKVDNISSEDMALMEREMDSLEKDFKFLEDSYGSNVLKLVQARGYLSKLLVNGNIVRYLLQNHSEILDEFQKIVESVSLDN